MYSDYQEETTQVLNQKFSLLSLLKFSFPTVVLMMFFSLYTMVDGFFISNYVGEKAFASVNIVFPFVSAIIAVGTMIGAGGCAIIAKSLGEDDADTARKNLTLITVFALLLSVIIVVLGLSFTKEIVRFLGATDILARDSITYLRMLLFFVPFSILQMISQMFFPLNGKPELGLVVGVAGGITNMVLDYLFIVLLDMGIGGAALATGIGYSIPAIAYILYFAKKRKHELYFKKPKWNAKALLDTCTNGSSEMVTNLAGTVTTFLFNITILKFAGEKGVAAVGVIMYAQFILQSASLGYAQGVAPILGYAYGAENHSQLKVVVKLSCIINIAFSIITYVFTILWANLIAGLFVEKGSETFVITLFGLKLFALSFLFQSFNIFTSAMFTAFSNGKVSAFISLMRTFVLIVLFVLILPQFIGVTGVWLSVPLAEFFALFLSLFFILKGRKTYHY